jgi:hypothetical protein
VDEHGTFRLLTDEQYRAIGGDAYRLRIHEGRGNSGDWATSHRYLFDFKAIAQSLALQQFRDNVRRALVLAYIKDGDDIRMIQGCGGLSLEFESTQTVGLVSTICRQDFDGDLTFQGQVASAIHLTHSARPEERDDLIGI